MASFRIREDAREWFSDISNIKDRGFATDFDAFYFCFMAGIATQSKKDASASETAEFIDHFPGRHRARGRLLVALFLNTELRMLGVDMNEKKYVHTAISRLIQPDSQNYLSDEGMKEFNKYAHGGYDVLLEWFDDRPRSLEVFLRMFKKKLDSHLKNSQLAEETAAA